MSFHDVTELVGFIQGDSKIQMNQNRKRIREHDHDEVINSGNKKKGAQENTNDLIEVIDLEPVKENEDYNLEPNTEQQQTMIINDLMYQCPRENPTIQIEVGCLTDCPVNAITSVIDCNSNIAYPNIFDIYGTELTEKLHNLLKPTFIHNEKIYQIVITEHNYFYLNKIFHCCISSFDYTTDSSEISFKNLIGYILKYTDEFDYKSIGILVDYWTDKGFPGHLLVKWIDSTIFNYLQSKTNHTIKEIRIVINKENIETIEAFKIFYKLEKLSRSLSTNEDYTLIDIEFSSSEYLTVCKHFQLTMPNTIINRIQKVSNALLEQMYSTLRETIKRRNPKNSLLEYKLFHGTSKKNIKQICKNGYNRSYCGKNGSNYGIGVYFARESKYSHQFVVDYAPTKGYEMFLSFVLVGEYEKGSAKKKYTGIKPDGNQYDSTVDNTINPQVFVVYNDYQAIPRYIIHYKLF